jgi:NADH-quinone oxidoreductase subunit J
MMGVAGGLIAAAFAASGPVVTTHPSWVDVGTFSVAASMVLSGAIGVVLARNAVHSALMLVMTLFGVAVLFALLREPFLAAVQVIVYAGAIVVLFLFVIMFLGVDRQENIATEPLRGQRPMAIALGLLGVTGLLLLGQVSGWTTGQPQVSGPSTVNGQTNVALLGKSIYTTYLFPFEATAALLIIAVVGAVVLARRPPGAARSDDERTADADGSASSTDGSVSAMPDEPAVLVNPGTPPSAAVPATTTATETPTPAPASREAAP